MDEIPRTQIEARIEQLLQERNEIMETLKRLRNEIVDGERLIHAYDGAIGELTALVTSEEKED